MDDVARDRILACIGSGGIPVAGESGFGAPGKSGRAIFAFYSPRPPLGSFTKEMGLILIPRLARGRNQKPSGTDENVPEGFCDRFLRSQLRRIGLGHPLGRDPSRTVEKRNRYTGEL